MIKLNFKEGDKVLVSWKGIRKGVFKNQNRGCAFVYFDNGDGTGNRLHRVLATTVKADTAKKEPKKEPEKAMKKASKAMKKALDTAKKAVKTTEDKFKSEELIRIAKNSGRRWYCTTGAYKVSGTELQYKNGKVYKIESCCFINKAQGIGRLDISLNGHKGIVYTDKNTHESFTMWVA